jgi:hypothetical protein
MAFSETKDCGVVGIEVATEGPAGVESGAAVLATLEAKLGNRLAYNEEKSCGDPTGIESCAGRIIGLKEAIDAMAGIVELEMASVNNNLDTIRKILGILKNVSRTRWIRHTRIRVLHKKHWAIIRSRCARVSAN